MIILDVVGALFSLISTYLFVTTHILAWPFGVIATLFNATLYYQTGIYGDASLELIYCASMFYGWYQWRYGGEQSEGVPISTLTLSQAIPLLITASLGTTLLYYLLTHHTHSQLPLQDAITTTLSLLAQYLLCKKIIETWLLWFIVDALYIEIYFHQSLPFHTGLLVIYLGMVVMGYVQWKKLAGGKIELHRHSAA